MGVQARIVVYAASAEEGERGAASAFDRIAELDAAMSDYRPDSELMRLCDRVGQGPVAVSPDLYDVLERSVAVSRASGGAFDVTVGPAVRLWREARRTGVMPEPEALARALALIGYEKMVLDPVRRTVELRVKGMRLDLGGIAKGYAARRAVEALRQRGLNRCLVALAGDIAAGDPPPGRAGWAVKLEQEQDEVKTRGPPPTILLTDGAVSTSGDTEQYVDIGGQRYSHLVDPKTGLGMTNRMSATVVGARGEEVDALASAVCVMGSDKGIEMLRRWGAVAAVVEQRADDGVVRTELDPSGLLRWTQRDAPERTVR